MPNVMQPSRPRRRLSRRMARLGTLSAVGYVCVAYLLAPEYWTLRDAGLSRSAATFLTATPQGIPGDPINLGLVGAKADLLHGFIAAGWQPADALTWRSAIDIGESVILDRPYVDAPVSTLTFQGRRQDLAFELAAGHSADTRHHVRFWLTSQAGADGRPVWLGSASFDRGVGLSHDTGQITHHIGPDIDIERDFIISSLRAAGVLISVSTIPGIGPTTEGRNGGGDPYVTDGTIRLGILAASRP